MDYAILQLWYRERTTNRLIFFSILGSTVLHLLFIGAVNTRQPITKQEPIIVRPVLKITVQPQLNQTPQRLTAPEQNKEKGERGESVTNKSLPFQMPSMEDIPQITTKGKDRASPKTPMRLDLISLENITKDVVKKLTDEELEESKDLSILNQNRNILDDDLPILPELDRALKQKHASIEKFADGLIQIVLPSGKTYCIRESDGLDGSDPSIMSPIATNCP